LPHDKTPFARLQYTKSTSRSDKDALSRLVSRAVMENAAVKTILMNDADLSMVCEGANNRT